MARYSLIVKDETYMCLVREAMRQGKSFGKLVNEILNDYAEKLKGAGQTPRPHVCIVCGRPATRMWVGVRQQRFFVCNLHKSFGKGLRRFKELGEKAR